jgi:hypothetical protein
MKGQISRRNFVKSSLLASAALPLAVSGAETPAEVSPQKSEAQTFPKGKLGNLEISRLIMGGNLIAGYAHSRDLPYVSTLMRRYNSPQRIRETLELGEQNGVTAINTWVMDDNSQIFDHWKNGGKLKWISQVRLDGNGGYSQVHKAIDQGAVAIHLTGDTAERLLDDAKFEKVGEAVEYIRSQKRVAGVAAHDLRVIVECEKRKLDVDFYQKTLHTNEYFTGPKAGGPDAVGKNDNSWCSDSQAVIDVFAKVTKPWIAFKVLAAGAIPPRAAFPYALNGGADFLLVGMFDWQVEEDVKLARRVFNVVAGPNSKRSRPWYGGALVA